MANIETIEVTHPTMVLKRLPPNFRFDNSRDGYKLVENVEIEGEPTLVLGSFLFPGERYENGYEIQLRTREYAKEKGACAGQLHMERMIERRENIPIEWRECWLMFFGTVWCDSRGENHVPCLYYSDHWEVHLHSLGGVLGRDFLAVLIG